MAIFAPLIILKKNLSFQNIVDGVAMVLGLERGDLSYQFVDGCPESP